MGKADEFPPNPKQAVSPADILYSDGSVFFNGLSSLGSTLVFIREGRKIISYGGQDEHFV